MSSFRPSLLLAASMTPLSPGSPLPLGATPDAGGTNFSVFSELAERVELCLFDAEGRETRHELGRRTDSCWHAHVAGVGAGQRYGYRVHGPFDLARGHLCAPAKLLLDPYAKATLGPVRWDRALHLFDEEGRNGELLRLDSAPFVPRSLVVGGGFDWGDDRPPRTPWERTLICELHVKGFTMRHPEVPPELRGTYAGLAHAAAIEHLSRLGVTAVELLPVQRFVHDERLVRLGLRNYWGYQPIGYFAPHDEYAADRRPGGEVREFREMVRALHAAGIEVLLDVVYNHTAEGGFRGPVLSFKGLGNSAYYRLDPDEPSRYVDTTGVGNSLDLRHPYVLQLVMDSLRYWVEEMHVDGFRFDLAPTLARDGNGFDPRAGFLRAVHQDPVLRRVKLIAEPWDLGPGGYQVGGFPPPWAEWNDKYRDCMRDFWRGQPHQVGEFASRLTGSSDLFEPSGRRPTASVDFVTAHDGFTLEDLVSYEVKRNQANGEANRDGTDDNRSWNCGVEGPTADPGVLALRRRQKRNLLATLLLSSGVPMLVAGDELGRTQGGNNNAYCQDSELSWLDWEALDGELLEFTRELARFRREHPVFRRADWFRGEPAQEGALPDIAWFRPSGVEMQGRHWREEPAGMLGVLLNGEEFGDGRFYLCINATPEELPFRLPDASWGASWRERMDTARGWLDAATAATRAAGEELVVEARSLLLLELATAIPI